jgi:hypothetical protein
MHPKYLKNMTADFQSQESKDSEETVIFTQKLPSIEDDFDRSHAHSAHTELKGTFF